VLNRTLAPGRPGARNSQMGTARLSGQETVVLVDTMVGLFFLTSGRFNEAGPRHLFFDPDEGRFVLLFFRLLALHSAMVASPPKGMQSRLAQVPLGGCGPLTRCSR
jgi:hypothetical protein